MVRNRGGARCYAGHPPTDRGSTRTPVAQGARVPREGEAGRDSTTRGPSPAW